MYGPGRNPAQLVRHRFRPLTWLEESRLKFSPKEDQRVTVLALALVDIGGFPVKSPEDAKLVLSKIPESIRRRVWVLYKGKLPDNQTFAFSGDLYDAPEPSAHNQRLVVEDEAEESEEDRLNKHVV